MKLRALILDVDGTLAETEEMHRAAFNQAFMEAGLAWRWDRRTYARLLRISGGCERILAYMRQVKPCSRPRTSQMELAKSLHINKTLAYARRLRTWEVRLRPGVARVLREAEQQGLKLAIATTSSRVNVENLLAIALAGETFPWASVVTGEQVSMKKPMPEAYLLTLERLGMKPTECLAVEDSNNGMRAALAAGIPVIVTPSAYTIRQDFTRASVVVDHLGDPGCPSIVQSGPALDGPCVNVAQLLKWHASWASGPPRGRSAALPLQPGQAVGI